MKVTISYSCCVFRSDSVDLVGIISYVAVFPNTETHASDAEVPGSMTGNCALGYTPHIYDKCYMWRISSGTMNHLGTPVENNVTND